MRSTEQRNSREKEDREKIVGSLKRAGEGLGNMGSAVFAMLAPFDAEDPTIKALVQRMLEKDSRYHDRYVDLNKELFKLAAKKRVAVEMLMELHQRASAATSQLTSGMTAQTELSHQRQSLRGVLDTATLTFLKGMEQRARASLQWSIYNFVQAYQYEFLADVSDDFYKFDSWVKKLRELEEKKQEAARNQLAAAQKDKNVTKVELERLEREANRVVRLGKSEFSEVEKNVLEAQLLETFVTLLERRQSETAVTGNDYKGCIFDSGYAEHVNTEGWVSFNFVDDFKKGTFKDIDFRAVRVDIAEFEVEPGDDKNLSLEIEIGILASP